MDEFYDELSLLLDQPYPMESTYPSQPLSSMMPDPFASPFLEETMITPMESPIPASDLVEPNIDFDVSNQWPASPPPSNPFHTTNTHFNFMPTPTLNTPMITPHDQLSLVGSMGPFPSRIPPTVIFEDLYPPFMQPNPMSDQMSHVGDFTDYNWEAVASFLAGQVRLGPDVLRVYKCSICYVEFPNAQAFGGHMSSHSKIKNGENSVVPLAGQSKKAKRCLKGSSSAKKGKAVVRASTSKNKKKVVEDEAESTDDSGSSEFTVGDGTHFSPWRGF